MKLERNEALKAQKHLKYGEIFLIWKFLYINMIWEERGRFTIFTFQSEHQAKRKLQKK